MYANAPMTPEPNTASIDPPWGSSSPDNLLAKWVMLQNRKRMVNELLKTDKLLAASAAVSGPIGIIRKRAKSMKNGAPGGWPTSNL